jgi:simple sugar transport system permease protein
MNVLDLTLIVSVAAGMLRVSTPIVFAGLGAVISERSGVINLGLEGLMLTGAFTAAAAQLAFGHWPLSLLLAGLAAALVGLLHGFFCVFLRASQVVTGLAVIFLCQGLTAIFGRSLVGRSIPLDATSPLAVTASVPLLGPILSQQDVMVFAALASVAAVSLFLFRARWGVLLRACGESAVAADAAGLPVRRTRLLAGGVCGAFCGLGGAHLSLFYAQQWQENMVAGRGWIALVMVIFGMWFPWRILVGAYLFGGLAALQLNLQARGVAAPQYLLAMLPFVATLVLLVVASWRLKRDSGWMPADLGNPFPLEMEGKD